MIPIFQAKSFDILLIWSRHLSDWYGQNGIRTKWYWTKWYGQNGIDKTTNKIINQYINSTPIDHMIFSSILLQL